MVRKGRERKTFISLLSRVVGGMQATWIHLTTLLIIAATGQPALAQQPELAASYEQEAKVWPEQYSFGKSGGYDDSALTAWRFQVDGLFLDRNTSAGAVLVRQNGTNNPVMDTRDLSFNGEAGTRLSVIREGECTAWEFSWMESDWTSASGVFDANNLNAITGSADYFNADGITTNYASDLDTFEINRILHASPVVSWLAGVRYVALDETFSMATTAGAQASNYGIRTANDLFGFQIGGRLRYCLNDRATFSVLGKSGVYYGARSQATDFRDNNNAPTSLYRNENDGVASLSEIDAGVTWQLLDRLALRGGFQYFWFQGVALAPEQFQNSLAAIAARPQPNSGSFDAYGGYVGAEFNW